MEPVVNNPWRLFINISLSGRTVWGRSWVFVLGNARLTRLAAQASVHGNLFCSLALRSSNMSALPLNTRSYTLNPKPSPLNPREGFMEAQQKRRNSSLAASTYQVGRIPAVFRSTDYCPRNSIYPNPKKTIPILVLGT